MHIRNTIAAAALACISVGASNAADEPARNPTSNAAPAKPAIGFASGSGIGPGGSFGSGSSLSGGFGSPAAASGSGTQTFGGGFNGQQTPGSGPLAGPPTASVGSPTGPRP